MKQAVSVIVVLLICVFFAPQTFAAPSMPIHLYLDADVTGSASSTQAIERGIRTALAENGNMLAGRPVELIVLNHRGNSRRSLVNLNKFLADPDALALFTGLHSPPLLAHRQFINDNGILVLNPWAAAGPITRSPDGVNWIFRLSVDDSKAGAVITRRAVDVRGFKRPALLLENTGWGKSNLKTMTASLKKRNITPAAVVWFDWGIKENGAKISLREIKEANADVIFLVANNPEGKVFSKAMHSLWPDERLPIVSHWGVTGGDFPEVITPAMRNELDIEFIQTSFSFLDMGNAPFPNKVFQEAMTLFPDIKSPADITSPTGFIHAYDLTRVLAAAIAQTDMQGPMKEARDRVRKSLENLSGPVQGLIKTYDPPFRPYVVEDKDAHEALGMEDLTFGRFGDHNEIILVR